MRISTDYLYSSSIRYMQQSVSNLTSAQEVMSTEQKVNHLSDDPVAVGRILDTSKSISQYDQYLTNISTGSTMSSLYDDSMDSAIEQLTSAKSLLLAESNSASSTETTRETARVQIVSIASQLVTLGNLQYGDKYLYGGYNDSAAPFLDLYSTVTAGAANTGTGVVSYNEISDQSAVTNDAYTVTFTSASTYDITNTTAGTTVSSGATYTDGEDIVFDGITLRITGTPDAGDTYDVTTTPAGSYVGDAGIIQLAIDNNTLQTVNFTGSTVFQGVGLTDGQNVFTLLQQANEALRTDDQTTISTLLDSLDSAIQQISNQQAIAGTRETALTSAEDRVTTLQTSMQSLLSDLKDADTVEATTELTKQETAYQAVLTATSKSINLSLFDFLS
ncbi:TPA: flagellar hook-associated protein 3 [Candidatus Sumerlaeota bacterium]|jgi:flagellar hook-associated protein 3 FlgL|nr:flagellar hook-associated protein 3 [Candidatus Sumerlaeota bacterium]